MRIIEQRFDLLYLTPRAEEAIEEAGRTCYKSEGNITDRSAPKFVKGLITRGHHAMTEFADMTIRFVTDRGVTHELVRHRLCNFGQESTRYCDYTKDKFDGKITFIRPVWLTDALIGEYNSLEVISNQDNMTSISERYLLSYALAAQAYKDLRKLDQAPQEARAVLPNSLKTEICCKANLREWRHIFKLRAIGTTGPPHPQMQSLMAPVLAMAGKLVPSMFEDLVEQYNEKYGPWEG